MKFELSFLTEAQKSSIAFFPQTCAWLESADKIFLAVAGNSLYNGDIKQEIKIYEFDINSQNILKKILKHNEESFASEESIHNIKWLTYSDKNFLALVGDVGQDGEELKIFSFDVSSSKLEKICAQNTKFVSLSCADWLVNHDQCYLAVVGYNGNLGHEIVVYKFEPEKAEKLIKITGAPVSDEGEPLFVSPKSVKWLITARGIFLAVCGDDRSSGQEIRIYKFSFKDGYHKLTMTENAPANSSEDPSFSDPYDLDWLSTDHARYLAVVGNDGDLNDEEIRVYNFIRTAEVEHMNLIAAAPTNNNEDPSFEEPRSTQWLSINGHNFLVVAGDDIATHQPIRIYKFDIKAHKLQKVAYAPTQKELPFPYIMSVQWLKSNGKIYLAAVGKGRNKREHHIRVYKFG